MKAEIGIWNVEGGMKSEVRRQMTDVAIQIADDGKHRAEIRIGWMKVYAYLCGGGCSWQAR